MFFYMILKLYTINEMYYWFIRSIIACGIIQVHYAFHNITNKSRLSIKFFAKVMAYVALLLYFFFLEIKKTVSYLWTLCYRFIG